MAGPREKWNARYRARDGERGAPADFLVRQVEHLRLGRVLDLACGDGRNALYLASRGFDVCGIDIAEAGLERLHRLAAAEGLSVDTRRRDLDDSAALQGLGTFDNAVVLCFKPSSHLWERIADVLVPGGILLVSTFSHAQHVHHGFPARFCLEPGALRDLSPRLACVHHEAFGAPEAFLEGYRFRRVEAT